MKWLFGWRTWLLVTVSLTPLTAQELFPVPKSQDSQKTQSYKSSEKRLWQVSLVTLGAANVLDIQSSLGKHELNAALAGSSGTLQTRGILLKSGFQGGLMGLEFWMIHHYSHGGLDRPRPKLYRTLSIINFASSAVLAGIAAHNYTVPRTQP
jgi:hypothetical protein